MKKTLAIDHLTIIGGGAWGTALSVALGKNFKKTNLLVREKDVFQTINNIQENKRFLPGIKLEPCPTAILDPSKLIDADILLCATPAQFLRATLQQIKPHLKKSAPIILASKGIEIESGALLTDIILSEAPGHPIGVLSGPTFAKDVARHKPSALNFAMQDPLWGPHLQKKFTTPSFRPYLTDDLIGVEVAGAFKNILAIGCGITMGARLGENAKAALLTRGLNELLRLILAFGGKKETLMSLSGIGDVILTCTSKSSRNFSLGFAIGRGQKIETYIKEHQILSEGYFTAKALHKLNKKLKLELPIFELIYHILYGKASIEQIPRTLLA